MLARPHLLILSSICHVDVARSRFPHSCSCSCSHSHSHSRSRSRSRSRVPFPLLFPFPFSNPSEYFRTLSCPPLLQLSYLPPASPPQSSSSTPFLSHLTRYRTRYRHPCPHHNCPSSVSYTRRAMLATSRIALQVKVTTMDVMLYACAGHST